MYKVFCVVAGLALVAPWWIFAQQSPRASDKMLASMRDKSRPLLIFYPQAPGAVPVDAELRRQQALLGSHAAELKNRDVEVILVPLPNGKGATDATAWADLRKEYRIDDRALTVVLVGKDGGEKFRSHKPVTIDKLVALIDAMPMRQQEVRDGHHPG